MNNIPKAYGGVTLMVSVVTGACLITWDVERLQRQYSFSQEFLEYSFNEQHQREVGDDTAGLGYPDDGNGRYMQARPYADWYL
jgi:hypothetical protein